MKKIFTIIIWIVMAASLSACAGGRPSSIVIEDSAGTFPECIAFIEERAWPENEYTQNIPVPPGTVSWIMIDSERETCSIQLNDISKAQFDGYYRKLLNTSFNEIEKVEEKIKGQKYVSIGTLVSDGTKTISLAYAESALMMTIVNRPAEGSILGFLQTSNLTNVYVNAYSTYDTEAGVQVVVELYVPERKTPKPAFTMVSGMATVTVGDDTTAYYLGSEANADAVGIAVNTKILGTSGEKGMVVIAGTAHAENAVSGCGSFSISYEITIP